MTSVTGKGRYLVVLCIIHHSSFIIHHSSFIIHHAIVDADETLAAIKEDLSGI
jgi:hypothetical protein